MTFLISFCVSFLVVFCLVYFKREKPELSKQELVDCILLPCLTDIHGLHGEQRLIYNARIAYKKYGEHIIIELNSYLEKYPLEKRIRIINAVREK